MSHFARMGENFEVRAYSHDELDITDFELLTGKILEDRPDYVVNTVALMVDQCEEDTEKAYLINSEAVKIMALACKKIGAGLIHISTDYVFDGENPEGYGEDDAVDPINIYGASKLRAEEYLQEVGGKYFIVRTSVLFGPSENNFVVQVMKAAKEGKEIYGATDQFASATYTDDLAEGIIQQIILQKKEPGIYHLTNSEVCSRFELAKEIVKDMEIEIEVKEILVNDIKRLAKRPKYSILKNNKLNPLRSWREALKVYVDLNQKK